MKFVTDCLRAEDGEWVVSTYKYEESGRTGEIQKDGGSGRVSAPTKGTFDLSSLGGRVVGSNSDGVCIYTSELVPHSYFRVGLSYKHAVCGGVLVSGSDGGGYWKIDLEKSVSERFQLTCRKEPCIYDVWSVYVNDRYIYTGCDSGTVTVTDKRSTDHTELRFQGGVTSIGEYNGEIEVGTYEGHYARLRNNCIDTEQRLTGIVWRVVTVTIASVVYYVVAQSYDGIGVYNQALAHLATVPTDDLVYAIQVLGAEKDTCIRGYNYYTGSLLEFNLFDLVS
ncbi:hypothetical protein NEDG_01827 [Nematocida displodere]|uniref:Uncharacterized protein n=1 Tax=Nematocida displodere TaxID=1805483 RepID=A0A177EK39_9MICR|nr:hypothetical protein NEDG_01827 [Nematocida displodere]